MLAQDLDLKINCFKNSSNIFTLALSDCHKRDILPFQSLLCLRTWCHRAPAETPTSLCGNAIRVEHQVDHVACACYGGRQGGAAAFLH